jgi:hypothetical protein
VDSFTLYISVIKRHNDHSIITAKKQNFRDILGSFSYSSTPLGLVTGIMSWPKPPSTSPAPLRRPSWAMAETHSLRKCRTYNRESFASSRGRIGQSAIVGGKRVVKWSPAVRHNAFFHTPLNRCGWYFMAHVGHTL